MKGKGEYVTVKVRRDIHALVKAYCATEEKPLPEYYNVVALSGLPYSYQETLVKKKKVK
jgi:hypothetical protein